MDKQKDKAIIHQMLLDNKEAIIQKYNENVPVYDIARLYEVAESTIYIKLSQWGIRKRRSKRVCRRENEKPARVKRNFSPEFLARRKENTQINNRFMKSYKTVETTHDKFLVQNILKKSEAIK